MMIDIVLIVLVLLLCICIAWKLGAGAVIGGAVAVIGGASSDSVVDHWLERYAIDPDETARSASEAVTNTRSERSLLKAIQYHWLYQRKPTKAARLGLSTAMVSLKMLTPAQRAQLSLVRSPDEVADVPRAPTAAEYFLEKSMRDLTPADKSTTARADTIAAELRAAESALRVTEADLRAARDDIRRLRDNSPNLSTATFLAECQADRKVLQERVYALRQEVATALATVRNDPSPRLQEMINDLQVRNSRLQSQLTTAVAPGQLSEMQAELNNCRRLLDEVLSAQ